MSLTPHQILSAARLLVIERAPYFRAGLLQLVFRERPDLGTFASSKDWVVYWDPEMTLKWGVEGTAAIVTHELWHLVRDHHGRFSAPLINPDLANIAGDLSINPGLQLMGFTLPVEGLMPDQFGLPNDWSAEQYYEALSKMELRYHYFDASGGGAESEGEEGDQKQGKGHRLKDGTVYVEGCGSCAGRRRRDEPEEGDTEGRSESEIARTRITIAKAIQQHGRGTVPGDLARWAGDALKPPKIRWQEKLARLARAAVAYRPGSGHSTYAKISRRQAGLGFGEGAPSIPAYRATRPRVTLLVDTSGSMEKKSLALAMAEAQGIFEVCGAQMDVVVCDADVHAAKTVKSIKEACAMLKGGGGSDFRPAFDQIMKKRPKTDIIVAATDGDITVPVTAPPGVTVIWMLVQKTWGGGFRAPCAWGTVVEVDE